MSAFLPQAAIRNKRDGLELTNEELQAFVKGASDGSVPDYQLSALLMAIYFRGFSEHELSVWAEAMLHSGDVINLSEISRAKIDKHSTGGVGDKISLPLAPAVAACGVAVPMISGRGLGHTGGTLDKLQSIAGFRVDLSTEQFKRQVDELGCCLIGQTDTLVPADRRLYALRDVTGTVESVPLIASSIMSKKLAEGIDGLVLDCKVGDGAFMGTLEQARVLAKAMLSIGKRAGKRVTAVLTDMNAPIGMMIGNALEVAESIDVLQGKGPEDTRDLTIELGAHMLALADGSSLDLGRGRIAAVLDNGEAFARFRDIVRAQGGDVAVIDDPSRLPKAKHQLTLESDRDGFIQTIRSRDLGIASILLGAGRKTKEDVIDPATGIEMLTRPGQFVSVGQPIAKLHYNATSPSVLTEASQMVTSCFVLAPEQPPAVRSRVLEVLT